MKFIIKVLLSGLAVVLSAYLLSGVEVDSFFTALIVALILAILNTIVRPILVVLTIPITFLTLGLFLLVINAIIILLADFLISGFEVANFWWALIFSIILAVINAVFEKISGD